jgi:uracil-DNA glycosylase
MSVAGNRLREPLDALLDRVDASWRPVVQAWRQSPAGEALVRFVDARREAGAVIFPADPLRALALTPLPATRVVILGQDPYHGAGQAEGLAFSVPAGMKLPPSLRNIFKELARDGACAVPDSGHLGEWARRGVLLLNTVLTVEEGSAASHAKRGWEALTDALIAAAASHAPAKVFMLWGSHAQAKLPLIEAAGMPHLVLQCNHPSPLSATRGDAPFIGCGHFGRAREFLAGQGAAIDWSL